LPEIEYREIKPAELLNIVNDLKQHGYRLVQICASRDKAYLEIDYSFDRDYHLIDLKMPLEKGEEISSISHIFAPAFLYENEINSLFGVKVNHMSVDFKGNLYITAKKAPFMDGEADGE
jgi:ech hydrogenase subunit D